MQSITKAEIIALGPCWPWVPAQIEGYPDDPSNGPDVLGFLTGIGRLDVLPWLMAGNTNLAAAFVDDAQVDIDSLGIHGRCALHFAAIYERVDVITWFVSRGALKTFEDIEGLTPVDLALATGNQAVIDAMGT